MEDGLGIIVSEPFLPDYMINMHTQIYKLEGDKDAASQAACRSHSVLVEDLNSDRKRHIKKTILRFPKTIRCNLSHFNQRDGQKVEKPSPLPRRYLNYQDR